MAIYQGESPLTGTHFREDVAFLAEMRYSPPHYPSKVRNHRRSIESWHPQGNADWSNDQQQASYLNSRSRQC